MESNQPIVHISITDMVADKLRDGIRDGTFRANQKLIETELCKIMEVSRTPIRKAFNVLIEEGLLERIQGFGVVVAGNDIERSYCFEILGALERVALDKAIKHITYVDLTALHEIQTKLEELWKSKAGMIEFNSDEWKAFSKLDKNFHNIIVRASGNPLIGEYIEVVSLKGGITSYTGRITDNTLSEHRILIQAIEDKDTVLADETMKHHFE